LIINSDLIIMYRFG